MKRDQGERKRETTLITMVIIELKIRFTAKQEGEIQGDNFSK